MLQLSKEEHAALTALTAHERRCLVLALPDISPEAGDAGVAAAQEVVRREREQRNARRATQRRAAMLSGNVSAADSEKALPGRRPTHAHEVPREHSLAISVNEEEHAAIRNRADSMRLTASDYARRMALSIPLHAVESHMSAARLLDVAIACARYARGGFTAADMGDEKSTNIAA